MLSTTSTRNAPRTVRGGLPSASLAVALSATLGLLAACDDLGGRQMPVTKPQPGSAPGPEAPATGGRSSTGSASTLGKARDSGLKIQDKADDYNRKIEEAAEEVGK